MPELPEVETIKNELLPHVIRRRISGVTLFWDGMVRQPSVEEFCHRIKGQEINGLIRRGKYLIFNLTNGEALILHLRMTGSLLLKPAPAEPDKHVRAILHLDNDTRIFFRDQRKFGGMWLVKDASAIVGKLGPEPLDAGFTPITLGQRLTDRTAPVKALFCDQTFLAGIGNMYADEALFAAGIHPLRSGGSLSGDEIEHLYCEIQQVLRTAIDNKGASVDTYLRPDGTPGTAHFEFKVAHRGGEPCPVCSTPIARIPIRSRGSYFCPKCQPEV